MPTKSSANAETLETLLKETEVITIFLRQQVKTGRISEVLYVKQIEKFVNAYEEYQRANSKNNLSVNVNIK